MLNRSSVVDMYRFPGGSALDLLPPTFVLPETRWLNMTVVDTIKDAVGLGDGHGDATAPVPASREAMSEARLPMAYRDSCAGLLIPLNHCRHKEWYLPWKCENERHSYEKCQYEEFKKRVAKMEELRASKAAAASTA
ncbi:hypothetical protein ABEF92_004544 [Exophiala dermatitidis]